MSAQPIRRGGGGKGRLPALARRALPLLIAFQVGLLSAAGAPGGGGVPTPAGMSVARLTRQVEPSVVDTITFADPAGTQILGTGIIVSTSGLILTDYHVIRDDVFVGVRVGGAGEVHPATVVLTDPDHDLALLEIQDALPLKPAELARTSSTAIGDPVLAIGNAMGLGQVPRAVAGRLVALHRSVSYGVGSGTVDLDGVIEAEASIFAGELGRGTGGLQRPCHRAHRRRVGRRALRARGGLPAAPGLRDSDRRGARSARLHDPLRRGASARRPAPAGRLPGEAFVRGDDEGQAEGMTRVSPASMTGDARWLAERIWATSSRTSPPPEWLSAMLQTVSPGRTTTVTAAVGAVVAPTPPTSAQPMQATDAAPRRARPIGRWGRRRERWAGWKSLITAGSPGPEPRWGVEPRIQGGGLAVRRERLFAWGKRKANTRSLSRLRR